MRINKFLASCGVASRRASEELILKGKVQINGVVVKNLATEVLESDQVKVNGKIVKLQDDFTYLVINKPKTYICSCSDEKDRKIVLDLLPKEYKEKRLFPVGRLDYDTEGLLILTNDGDFANKLAHPSNQVSKTYNAVVENKLKISDIKKLESGTSFNGVQYSKCHINVLNTDATGTLVQVIIHEGRNHQVKNMFKSIDNRVVSLKRVAIGNLELGDLPKGKIKEFKKELLEKLIEC
ncbi:MAG: rRNA pseudouridine synthase [Firmicutes bacterium]|nr:rRNA pseudouridine synthase [Bacillota bacterium]